MDVPVGYGWDDVFVKEQDLMRFLDDHWQVAAVALRECAGFTMEKIDEVKQAVSYGDALSFSAIMSDFVSDTGVYGQYGIIAKVIEGETGIRIWYMESSDGEDCVKTILFPYLVPPWDLSDTELSLDEGLMRDLFRRYMDELGAHDRMPGTIYMEV